MSSRVLQLYPLPSGERQLRGLYLDHRLHELGAVAAPFVYANFVSSLDGRIALTENRRDGESYVPETLTTAADWALFQELQAQADCLITHSGYLHALAAGKLDDILQVGTDKNAAHLLEWRKANGLHKQPAIVVLSTSLTFPPPASVKRHEQRFYIATGERAERIKVRAWQSKGYEVLFAGKGQHAQAQVLIPQLAEQGFRSVYLQAGPLFLDSVLRDGCLDRFYLTLNHSLLGGERFHTLLSGKPLGEAGRLNLRSLYYDHAGAHGQWFACFETLRRHEKNGA